MTRRLLPFLLLALAFALPAAAGAAVKVAPQGTPDRAMSPERALSKAEAAAAGRQVRGVDDLTPLLRQIAVAQPDLSRHDRKRARRVLSRPTGSGGSAAGNYTVAEHKAALQRPLLHPLRDQHGRQAAACRLGPRRLPE